MANTIKEYLETIDSFEIWGEEMGDLADENYGKITVYEIPKENLFNSEKHYDFDEVDNVEFGDWDGLAKIINPEDATLEKEYIEEEFIPDLYEDFCESCVKKQKCDDTEDCIVFGHALLFCEGQYIFSGTNYSNNYTCDCNCH